MTNSPPPGTPQTPHKAIFSAIGTFIGIALAYWIADDDPFTKKEAAEAFLTAGIGSGVLGFGTYKIRNRPQA